MKKYDLRLNVSNIQKDRLETRSYTKKDGTEVTETNLKATIILNKDKVLKEDEQKIWKEVGFIVESGKKEDNTNILGQVTETIWKGDGAQEEVLDPSEIPFR